MKPKVQPGQFWYDQRDLGMKGKSFVGVLIGCPNEYGDFQMNWKPMPGIGQPSPNYWPENDIHRYFILDETQNVELILAKYDE